MLAADDGVEARNQSQEKGVDDGPQAFERVFCAEANEYSTVRGKWNPYIEGLF